MESTSTVGAPYAPETDVESPPTEVHASLLSGVGKQCAVCSAPLAPDQRYCLECGERSGTARLPLMERDARSVADAAVSPRGSRRLRMSPNSSLIAGIGILLLAMGIGVLIGRTGDSSTPKSSSVQVVTVPSGGAAGTAATTTTTSSAATGGSKSKKAAAKKKSSSTSAAIPKTKKKQPPPVVKVGSKGTGQGYQNGKFTGNFFGN